MPHPPHELVTLVVVTHNSADFIAPFTDSLRAATADLTPPRMLIADAGSTDSTRDAIATACPDAEILALDNIGFGAAANAAAARVTTPWFLLCNPDLEFPTYFFTALQRVIPQDAADQTDWIARTAVFAPRLLNPDETPQPSAGRFPTVRAIFRDQFRPRPQRKYMSPQPETESLIDWASAACLLIRKKAFDAVGGFDPHYFLYVEEVDLQKRLHDAGWDVRAAWPIVPAWDVTHIHPNATRPPRPEVQRYAARGLLRYFARHGTGAQLTAYRLLALLSRRLPAKEAFAPRDQILTTPTGP